MGDAHDVHPCTVCMAPVARESMAGSAATFVLSCGHRFHALCIARWLDQHSTCPSCNRIVAAVTRVVLQQHLSRQGSPVASHDSAIPSACASTCRPVQPPLFVLQPQAPPRRPIVPGLDDTLAAGSRWMMNVAMWLGLVILSLAISEMIRA